MSNKQLLKLTISELAPKIKSRELSPAEVTQTALEQIERLKPNINSFITVLGDEAMKQAKDAEKAIMRGNYKGPLHGVPIGLKDNLATKGIRTTIGSKVFSKNVPDEDAFVVTRLREAGAVVLGKENLHEFAMGVSSNNPHYGAVHNPWSLDSIPGGSSGGSAANVASCMTFASLGTDAGGSVRIPSSLCGVVGIKATYGRVSQRGLLSSAFGHDHIGPMTRSVRDNALMLQAIAGYDSLDSTTAPVPVPDYTAGLSRNVRRLKMGIPKNYFFADPIDPEVSTALDEVIKAFEEMGIKSKEIALPNLEYAPVLRIISSVENLVIHDEIARKHKKDYGDDVYFRMLPAQFVTAVDFARCLRVQRLIIDDFLKTLQDVDFIVTPATPIPAYPIDAETITVKGVQYTVKGPGRGSSVVGRNTFVGNHIGLPALSVPCGLTKKGLPIGLQLYGRPFEEGLLYRVAYHYEEVSPMKGKFPKVAG